MKNLLFILLLAGLFVAPAVAQTHWNHVYANEANGYYDANGAWHGPYAYSNDYAHSRYGYYNYPPSYDPVRRHKRRRNVLLGVGALGLVTGSGILTGVGLGGAAANEIVDHRNRDY